LSTKKSAMSRRPAVLPLLLAFTAAWPFAPTAAAQVTPLTLDQAMADPAWIGPPVEQLWWRWDGRAVNYTLQRAGSNVRDAFTVPVEGGAAQLVDDAARAGLDGTDPVYDQARRQALFVRNGDIFLRDLASGALRQLTRTDDSEGSPQFAADQRTVQFRSGDDWFRWSPVDGVIAPVALLRAEKDPAAPPAADALRTQQLRLSRTLSAMEARAEAARDVATARRRADPTRAARPVYLGDGLRIGATSLSPDGRWLLVTTLPKDDGGREGKMPRYVTTSGYEEMVDVRTRVGRNVPVNEALKLIDLRDGTVRDLAYDPLPGISVDPLASQRQARKLDALEGKRALSVADLQWSDDGRAAAVQLRSVDNKDRWIATVDLSAARLLPQHRLTDPAWINWNFNEFGWLPDNRTLWYLSEESGYSHLYTLAPGGKARQRTSGKWEASSPQLSADGGSVFFLCNRARPGDYELCRLDFANDAVTELTALDGVEGSDYHDTRPEPTFFSGFSLSPDGRSILFRHSSPYVPSQAAVVGVDGGAVRELTDTRTAEYKARTWVMPEFVQVPSKHGAGTIWAKLYRPVGFEAGKKYPIVLFVHGAGYTQNVHSRFPYYFREQMFHHRLAERGYLVLDMDYRASEGYGRDWRTAIYRNMGHPELEDHLDGIDWLAATQQGDAGKVGRFHAGAALRPVTDWTSYNHGYTANILNTPELDPEAFKASSPIEYAEGLQGHLLIAHGMLDDNVFFQDSVRLAQRLIELKKDHWELASYPLERHGFDQPESWYDEFRRIEQLFDRALK
jgi:dipeptidyl aminopeptidase/acylaminoacyl peptidase